MEPEPGNAGGGIGIGAVSVEGYGFLFMLLTINGRESVSTRAVTLKDLMEELDIKPERVAAEVNMKVIKKKDYSSTMLKDGDKVELVNFVGGG